MENPAIKHSEFLTRKLKIDKVLEKAGWKVINYIQKDENKYSKVAVREYPTLNGPADYALFDEGQPIAVVEAKKEMIGPQNVLEQAKRYAKGIKKGLSFGEYGVPFAYSTNGEKIFFQDLRIEQSYSRETSGFHTINSLRELMQDRFYDGIRWLRDNPLQFTRARPYQREAIEAIEKNVQNQKRKIFISMATGTGKTFTLAMQIYRLMKSGVGKRILFLVDRRALAAQTVKELASFEAEPGLKFDKIYEVYSQKFKKDDFDKDEKYNPTVLPNSYLTSPNSGQAFVYVCTIQRMRINLFGKSGAFEEEDGDYSDENDIQKIDIPIHAFDIIIADECHRGYTAAEISKWRDVLNHFDAIKIGLTATPAAHTVAYFGTPVFNYSYEKAIQQGYLVDYDSVKIHSKIKINGLFLKENELVEFVDAEVGSSQMDKLEDERAFEASKIEREITAPDSTKKVIQEVSKYLLEQEKIFGRFPKTLIFAVNDLPHVSHADQVVTVCRDLFGRGDKFVQKITGSPSVDNPLQKIREFRNRPDTGIVVTVDMLSTGVDIPALENIVFLRFVKSRILFTQMLGRGTRKCDEIGKDHFTIFDCFGGGLLEYFGGVTDFTVEPPDKPTRTIQEIVECIYHNKDRKYNVTCLVKRLQRIPKNMDGSAVEEFSRYIPDGDVGRFAQGLSEQIETNFTNTMKLLQDKGFQELLISYPRKSRTFLKALQAVDDVSSEFSFKIVGGKELSERDYIEAFTQFVKDNPEKIDAIKILLSRPSEWGTKPLVELKSKLKKSPYKFTEDNLRKAYHHDLADIISIIKHAAKDEPLLSAEDRVEQAIHRLTKSMKLTRDQQDWLELIKQHLIENLAIEKQDFEEIPVLSRHGGFKAANKIFGGKIEEFLKKINQEVAR